MKCNEYETKSGKPIRLWQGDCMELIKSKPEDHWDLAICDPEYGIGYEDGGQYFKQNNGKSDKEWDSEPVDPNIIKEIIRVAKNQILWGANYYSVPPSKGWISWYKTDEIKGRTFSEFELAYSSFDKPARQIVEKPFIRNGGRIHPTQKPVRVYQKLLRLRAQNDDTILDTHGGSMSLAIACYIEDYELDIIELDEDYYNDAVNRFEQHISQKTLF